MHFAALMSCLPEVFLKTKMLLFSSMDEICDAVNKISQIFNIKCISILTQFNLIHFNLICALHTCLLMNTSTLWQHSLTQSGRLSTSRCSKTVNAGYKPGNNPTTN